MPKYKTCWTGLSDKKMLHELQRDSFEYFIREVNPANGLVFDRSQKGWPSSIAAVGLGLTCYPVGVERSFLSRAEAIKRTLATLRFFRNSVQGTSLRATGYKGFYYHFLNTRTGQRAWNSELSTMDTAILLAGMLFAATYFDRKTGPEREIREIADALYQRADWQWGQESDGAVTQGWKPKRGFLRYKWRGYSEALLLYVLALGSPTHALPRESYKAFTAGYESKNCFGQKFLYAGPLFIHQLPQVWLDLREVQDDYMLKRRTTYFENSRKATLVQQRYAMENPSGFARYSEHCWGITASDGPGDKTRRVGGKKRRFYDYIARGVPFGPDDGTISPWAVIASLPFAPEIVLPTIRYLDGMQLRRAGAYGFDASFNPTYPAGRNPNGWVSRWHYGLNQGPVVLMIENYQTGFVWELMRNCRYLVDGLRRAGFRGGWLGKD
jgi:hypothetical protein